jgi:hypothetical protein
MAVQGALANIKQGIRLVRSAALAVAVYAVASAVQGVQLVSSQAALIAFVELCLFAIDRKLHSWVRQLIFTDYVHAERN